MLVYRNLASIALVALVAAGFANGPLVDQETISKEVKAALFQEVEAFQSKDCDRTLELWSDQALTMIFNGKITAQTKDEMRELCERIFASLPPQAQGRPIKDHSIKVLTAGAAVSTTEYLTSGPPGSPPAVVTKVWQKTGSDWRIVHMHESTRRVSER